MLQLKKLAYWSLMINYDKTARMLSQILCTPSFDEYAGSNQSVIIKIISQVKRRHQVVNPQFVI